jgi:protein-disulfide isomerase
MKITATIFCLFLSVLSVFAQKAETVLATANGRNYTAENLSPDVKKAWENLSASIAETRRALLSDMIAEALLTAEARARGTTVEKLVGEVKAKIPAPLEAEIRQIYDANRDALGNRTLEEAKPQIVAFLRREPEQKALMDFINGLNAKYKPVAGRDVNAAALRPTDVLATVGGKAITVQEFDAKNRLALYEFRAEIFDAVRDELEEAIFNDMVMAEAKAQNVEPSDLLAREITDKMREFSDDERETLNEAFRQKLFTKYKAKISLKEPAPVAQKISADDDPARGAATAPVTIVMFTDFQCPACAATHPVLEKVIAGYGNKVRFVVRDFPLVNIHKDAFLAAQAANAARAQGKFFEYAEVLYRNQAALDAGSLKKYAADLGLNARQFELDLQSGKYADEVRRDMADGAAYGITGTPAIFVNGVRVRELSTRAFRRAIDRALAAGVAARTAAAK